MVPSAAGGGSVSVASVSALYLEHLGTSVRSAQHVETLVALQGENTFMPSEVNKGFCRLFLCNCCFFNRKIQDVVSLRYMICLFF